MEPIAEAATEGRRSSEEFAEGQHHFEAPFVLLRHLALTSGSSPSQTQLLSMIFEELLITQNELGEIWEMPFAMLLSPKTLKTPRSICK